jgi:E3 ubiquitin-protein ligase RNF14
MANLATEDERGEELDTLQSIYPELTILSTKPLTADIYLAVSPVKPLSVMFGSDQGSYQLTHLPQLHLQLTLPENYPAKEPPQIKLATEPLWLPDDVLALGGVWRHADLICIH